MKKETIAIIGLGYWGSIVTNTLVTLKIFKKIYICDSDHKKVQHKLFINGSMNDNYLYIFNIIYKYSLI